MAAARLKAGLTQQEFARVTGAWLGTVRKWERGERSPRAPRECWSASRRAIRMP